MTPPRTLLPLYRTQSYPVLPTERTAVLRRAQAAQLHERQISVYRPPLWANILTIVTTLLTMAGLVAMAIYAPDPAPRTRRPH